MTVRSKSARGHPRQAQKPNILFIVSDDTGYGDLGPYGGGKGRGPVGLQKAFELNGSWAIGGL